MPWWPDCKVPGLTVFTGADHAILSSWSVACRALMHVLMALGIRGVLPGPALGPGSGLVLGKG